MVDTPKENNGEEQKDATTPKKQPKRQRQRRRSKSRHSKNSDNGIRKNNTSDAAKDKDSPVNPAMEQDESGDSEHSPRLLLDHSDAEDKTYKSVSGEEKSPDDDTHIIPEKHLEQEHLHRWLIAITRSLKKQK